MCRVLSDWSFRLVAAMAIQIFEGKGEERKRYGRIAQLVMGQVIQSHTTKVPMLSGKSIRIICVSTNVLDLKMWKATAAGGDTDTDTHENRTDIFCQIFVYVPGR